LPYHVIYRKQGTGTRKSESMSLAAGLDNTSIHHSIVKSQNSGTAPEADSKATYVSENSARSALRSSPSASDREAKVDSIYYEAVEDHDLHPYDFLPTLLKSSSKIESTLGKLPVQTKDKPCQVQSSEHHFGVDLHLCSRIFKHDIAPATPPKDEVNRQSKQIALAGDAVDMREQKVLSPSVHVLTGQLERKRLPWSLEDVKFKSVRLPDYYLSDKDARDLLYKSFPDLCEAPVRKFGKMEELFTSTKVMESSLRDKDARKKALVLTFKGKKVHSMIKSVVNLESRSATWKRLGSAQERGICLPLPLVPDPWDLECYPKFQSDKLACGGKTKHAFEMKASRRQGLCSACNGKGVKICSTCNNRGSNMCKRCSGTGKRRNMGACEECTGEGKLKCQSCLLTLTQICEPCKGEGSGLYAAIAHITFRRICFPPVRTSDVVFGHNTQDPSVIRAAAIERTKEMIGRLDTIRGARGTDGFRPMSASCSWEVSNSSLLEVEISQAADPLTSKHRKILRRQSSLISQIAQQKQLIETRFFMLPAEAGLQVLEMSKEEFKENLEPDILSNSCIKYELIAPPFG
jgi:hypothetical protein